MSNIKIRYGRVDIANDNGDVKTINVPKNTLSTHNRNDRVFFGIARCNLNKDACRKETGVRIANTRAQLASEIFDDTTNDWVVDKTGLLGSVKRDSISKLFDYFYSIDSQDF